MMTYIFKYATILYITNAYNQIFDVQFLITSLIRLGKQNSENIRIFVALCWVVAFSSLKQLQSFVLHWSNVASALTQAKHYKGIYNHMITIHYITAFSSKQCHDW